MILIFYISLGQSSRNLDELYTSFKPITSLVHRFEAGGVDGLKDKEGRGRHSRLDSRKEDELKKILTGKLPSDYGFNTAIWAEPILMEWLKANYNIAKKEAQIYNILKRLGFIYQKGRVFFLKWMNINRKSLNWH